MRTVWLLAALAIASVAAVLHVDAAELLIVDGSGNQLMRCELPTEYLPGAHVALVCDAPPIFRDGFE